MSYEVEQSFRNLIMYYRTELLYINSGARASDYFSNPQRKKLVKQGVLERVYLQGGCRLKLTKKANNVLSAYMHQQL